VAEPVVGTKLALLTLARRYEAVLVADKPHRYRIAR
jgi:hypothetical protein